MAPHKLALLLALLPGCWVTDAEVRDRFDDWSPDHGDDTGVPPDPVAFRVLEVSPPWGPSTGGTEVEIVLDTPVSNPEVTLGGKAAEVRWVEDDTIRVVTAPTTARKVDVTVTVGESTATLPNAFEFFQDQTGRNRLLGGVHWYDYRGPDLPDDAGYSWLAFIEPSATTWRDISISDTFLDRCHRSFDRGAPRFVDTRLDQVNLRPEGELPLGHAVAADNSFERDLHAAEFTPGVRWQLDAVDLDGIPEVDVPGIAHLPTSFDLQSPDLEAVAYVPRVLELTWDVSEPGDYVVMVLERYDWGFSGATLTDTVTCAVVDDGSFTIGYNDWTNWAYEAPIRISVGRVHEASGVFPHDNSGSGVAGVYWNIGWVKQGI